MATAADVGGATAGGQCYLRVATAPVYATRSRAVELRPAARIAYVVPAVVQHVAERVLVTPDLSIPGHPEVYVAGDLASVASGASPVPGTAPAAKQMGRHVALNLMNEMKGKARAPFRYRDYGQLATIGRAAAVVDMGRFKLSGFPAWIVWLVAHIYFLINFRNRIVVMIDWASSYWTYSRYARIFTRT